MLRHVRMHQRGPTAGGSGSRDGDDPPQVSPSRPPGPLAPHPQTDAAWANSFAAFQRTSTPPIAAPPPPATAPTTSIVPPIPLPSQPLAPPGHVPPHPLGQGFIGGGGVQFPPQPMATPMPTAAVSLVDGTDNTTDLWQLLYNDLLPGSDSLHTSPHFLDSIGLGSDLFIANQKPQAQAPVPATATFHPPPSVEPMHGSAVLPSVRLPDQPLLPSTPIRAQAMSLEREPSREVEHEAGRSQAAIREVRSLVADLVSMSHRAYLSASLMQLSVQQSHHRRQPLICSMARPMLWPILAKIPPDLPHPPPTNVQRPDNVRTAAAQHDRYRLALPPRARRPFQGAPAEGSGRVRGMELTTSSREWPSGNWCTRVWPVVYVHRRGWLSICAADIPTVGRPPRATRARRPMQGHSTSSHRCSWPTLRHDVQRELLTTTAS